MMFYIYAGRACVSPVERVPKVDEVQQVQARASPLANLKPPKPIGDPFPMPSPERAAGKSPSPQALHRSHHSHLATRCTPPARTQDLQIGVVLDLIGLAALSLAETRFGDCSRAPPQVSPHQQPAACGATFAAAAPARPQPPRRDSLPALSEAAAMRHGLAARRTVGVGHVCIIGPHATGQC